MTAEFDCCECGSHVIAFDRHAPDPALCALCLFLPGWFREERLRNIFLPSHDGREVLEHAEPAP